MNYANARKINDPDVAWQLNNKPEQVCECTTAYRTYTMPNLAYFIYPVSLQML